MNREEKMLWGLMGLAILGAITAYWLLSVHINLTTGSGNLVSECVFQKHFGGAVGCENVALSKYSVVLGIPLAAYALAYYFTQFFLFFWAKQNPQTRYEPLYVALNLSTISILVTACMIYIARAIVHSFCPGCASLWTINLLTWPLLVKTIGLSWGEALQANCETFFPKKMTLKKTRVIAGYIILLIAFAFTAIGSIVVKTSQSHDFASSENAEEAIIQRYKSAPVLYVPEDAKTGNQVMRPINNGKAKLEIVILSDFQCPACRVAAQMLKPFLIRHQDEVLFSYRTYPLDASCNHGGGMHPFACAAARAAICAGEQGKFFPYHDLIFDNQATLSQAMLEDFAKTLELDFAKWQSCITDPKTELQIQKAIQLGDNVGLDSTPTILINGHKLTGAISPKQWEALLSIQ